MTNCVGAAPISLIAGDVFEALDNLPPLLKRAIWQGVVAWDPREITWAMPEMIRRGTPEPEAVRQLAEWLRDADQREVEAMATNWPGGLGPYPHVAAGATIQPYDHGGKSRMPREAGAPPGRIHRRRQRRRRRPVASDIESPAP